MNRYTVAVVAPGTAAAAADRLAHATEQPAEIDHVIDPVDHLDPRRSWPTPAGASAVVQVAGHRAEDLRDAASRTSTPLLGVLVVERTDQGRRHAPVGDRGGLTQISFVRRVPDLTAEQFGQRYASHREIVEREHPGVAHYRQDIVVDLHLPTAQLDGVVAVSQLWFPTEEDFAERYYASETSPAIVRADVESFLDYSGTWSVLTRERHLVPPP